MLIRETPACCKAIPGTPAAMVSDGWDQPSNWRKVRMKTRAPIPINSSG